MPKFSKPPLLISQQIEVIKGKKMIVENDQECESILRKINYQHILCYKKFFSESDFESGDVTFKKLYEIYELDLNLRMLFFSILMVVELKLKTELAYFHVIKHGNHGYLNPNNFENKKFHSQFVNKLIYDLNEKKSLMIKNHYEKYDDDLPFYKVIETLSFGSLSKFYSNLEKNDKKSFVTQYYPQKDIYLLKSWLKTLVDIRNDCAHNSPLFINSLISTPKKLKTKTWDKYVDTNIGIIPLMLKEILSGMDEYEKFKKSYIDLIEICQQNIPKHLNLPNDWKNDL